MGSNHRAKRKRSNRRTTKPPTAASPTSSPAAGMSSILNNARNTHIAGGTFNITTNVKTVKEPSLEVLYERVAPNAILNAGGRAEEVRCHPGTREEVIGRIEKWGNMQDSLAAPMFWLSGPAGAGKSAIVQTIAERCEQRGVPHANFFFFRADTSRSNASPLVATLLHQIVLLYPSLQDPVAALLASNPLIFDSVLEKQLAQLIVAPLRNIQQSSSAYRPLILLIDGLDECDSESKRSQQQILRAFDKILGEQPCPFRLLVASRDESQIRAAFNGMSLECLHLYLNNQYSPQRDIRVFVNAEFEWVRKTHPLAHTLDARWPSLEDINYIVEKSSGQFIYAATVMRFISDSAASPMLSLERVQGAARLASKSPFSHLDAIYSYILSQADEQETLKDILHAQLLITTLKGSRYPSTNTTSVGFGHPSTNTPLEMPLLEHLKLYNQNYTKAMVLSCLADLTPIVQHVYSSHRLLFHHASFPDFLLDQSRSGDYFVDLAQFSHKILPVIWRHINREPQNKTWLHFGLCGIMHLPKLPPGLMDTLAFSLRNVWFYVDAQNASVFQSLLNLCICDNDFVHFRRIMCKWIDGKRPDFDEFKLSKIQDLPFGRRYFYMACAAKRFRVPDSEMFAALCPETDGDRQELTLWLHDLLRAIYREIYRCDAERYMRLMTEWISWAVSNDISCDSVDNLPNAWQYVRRSMEVKQAAEDSSGGSRK